MPLIEKAARLQTSQRMAKTRASPAFCLGPSTVRNSSHERRLETKARFLASFLPFLLSSFPSSFLLSFLRFFVETEAGETVDEEALIKKLPEASGSRCRLL